MKSNPGVLASAYRGVKPRGRNRPRAIGRVGLLAFGSLVASAVCLSTKLWAASAADPGMASVRVVHGLGGVVADVYFDSALVLQTFQPETSTDLFEVDAGPHTVDIRLAGSLAAAPPLLTGRVDITPGKTWSLVAHLAADGKPTLSTFEDDVTAVPPGQTRVVVRPPPQRRQSTCS